LRTTRLRAGPGSPDKTFRYSVDGQSGITSNQNSYNTAPRGIATNSTGNKTWVIDDNDKVYVYDIAGILQGSWLANGLTKPEGIATDGTNIWIVDAGSNQVVKFDADGRFQLVLGRKPENITLRPGPGVSATAADAAFLATRGGPPAAGGGGGGGGGGGNAGRPAGSGINGDGFNRPSDVTWDRAGNIYIADGFGSNNRIAKFDKNGDFLKTWGSTGSSQGQFSGIRGIATDAAGNIYVADAGNKRIQVFDGEGTFKSQITNIGSPQAICISGGSTQFLYSSNSNDPESMDAGEIYKVQLSGQVVGKFGKAGKLPKEFGMVNAIDCRTENDLWVGEVWNWRAQKITLKR
jgi:hypothetical protein